MSFLVFGLTSESLQKNAATDWLAKKLENGRKCTDGKPLGTGVGVAALGDQKRQLEFIFSAFRPGNNAAP